MTVKDLTVEELQQIVKETVRQELINQQNTHKSERIYLTYDELSNYLGISKAKIEKLKRDSKIPFVQIDGNVRFHKKQIDLWMLHNGDKLTFIKRDVEKYSIIIN